VAQTFSFQFFHLKFNFSEFFCLAIAKKNYATTPSSFIHVKGGGNWTSLQVSTHAAQTTMSHRLMRM